MRNYVRYIVLLILIIAGGLLIISVVNKFTEPDVSKVNNKNKTEETTNTTQGEGPTLDVDTCKDASSTKEDTTDNDDSTTTQEDTSSSDTTTDNTTTTTEESVDSDTNNVVVPDTGTKDSIIYTILGFTITISGVWLVKRNTLHANN